MTKAVRISFVAAFVAFCLFFMTPRRAAGLDGLGTEQEPYIITNIVELQQIRGALGSWYVAAGDIDASDTVNWNDGAGFIPIGDDPHGFTGNFDGRGYTIIGLYIDRSGTYYVGLFGAIDGGTVRSVHLLNCDITGQRYVGALAGRNSSGVINDCSAIGSSVSGDYYAGGLLGRNDYGPISDCYTDVSVFGTYEDTGGFVGVNAGVISDCYAGGDLIGSISVGGFLGRGYSGSITRCYTVAQVMVIGSDSVGGLVGDNKAIISECLSQATVNGSGNDCGGLVGMHRDGGVITNCYSLGAVSGDSYVGGLVGGNIASEITSSYSAGSVDAPFNVGGLVGYNSGSCQGCFWDRQSSNQDFSACGTGKITADMKQQSTFAPPWDFSNVWFIDSGNDYPRLRAFVSLCGDQDHLYPTGDLNADCWVDMLDFAIFLSHWLECAAPECD